MLIGNETGAEKAQEANSPEKLRSRSGKGEGRGMGSKQEQRPMGRAGSLPGGATSSPCQPSLCLSFTDLSSIP